MQFKDSHYWALILGGSSGIGLATARKLAKEGMNLCIVHRDRRASLPAIETDFTAMRSHGVKVLSFNANALAADERRHIIAELKQALESKGKVRLLLHSIAKGNLKPLAGELRKSEINLEQTVHENHSNPAMPHAVMADETAGETQALLCEEDFQQTIHAMAIS